MNEKSIRGATKRFSYVILSLKLIILLFLFTTISCIVFTVAQNTSAALEDAKQKGYDLGYSDGYTQGYNDSINELANQIVIEGFKENVIYIKLPNGEVHEYNYDFTSAVEQIFGYTDEEIKIISGTIYGEANSVPTENEKAAVGETIVNRLAMGQGTIEEICNRFYSGFKPERNNTKYYNMAKDVLNRFYAKQYGCTVARVLPDDYIYFVGDGKVNHFTNSWPVRFINEWNFTSSPAIY